MKRFRKTTSGYVFDELLLFLIYLPALLVLLFGVYDQLTSEYTFYYKCETSSHHMYCDSPFTRVCPRQVLNQMPELCEMDKIPPGEYGEEPHWTWDFLPAMSIGLAIVGFTVNHLKWNMEGKE